MKSCPICKKEFKQLTAQHIWKHGLSVEELKKNYPDADMTNDASVETASRKKESKIIQDNIRCIQCNILIVSCDRKYRKFCSHSCAANYNNNTTYKEPLIKICQNCLKKFNASENKRKYCSKKCMGQHKSKIHSEINEKLFKEGKLHDNNRYRIKKTMLNLGTENKCSICGITDWQGKPIPFILDHIDGDSSNNMPHNLRLVCSNCDSQSPHYMARNKGRGRKSLRLKNNSKNNT